MPVPLRTHLRGHQVSTAYERNWQQLANGDLIQVAEDAGFDALVTTDKNLKYQQNLSGRRLVLIVLPTTSWKKIQMNVDIVVDLIEGLTPGDYVEAIFRD